MAVLIVQCLCPSRHCLMGLAIQDAEPAEAEAALREMFLGAVAGRVLNAWCGICGSTELTFEARRSRFQTLLEAQVDLAESELRQAETRAALDAQGRTYDAILKRGSN